MILNALARFICEIFSIRYTGTYWVTAGYLVVSHAHLDGHEDSDFLLSDKVEILLSKHSTTF